MTDHAAHGVMFHHLHGGVHPKVQGSIGAGTLNAMIRWIGTDRVVDAGRWLDLAKSGRLKGEVCLSFDDTLKCQYDVAMPVLERFGLTAFWYVYTEPWDDRGGELEVYRLFRTTRFASIEAFYHEFFKLCPISGHDPSYLKQFSFYTEEDRKFRYVRDKLLGQERYDGVMRKMMEQDGFDVAKARASLWMSPEDVKTLHGKGHEIGMHSYTHPTGMADLDPIDQLSEYTSNHADIIDVIDQAPRTMAHPCNSYSGATLAILRDFGVEMGWRSNMESKENKSGYEYPRMDSALVLREMTVAGSGAGVDETWRLL